MNQHIDTQEVRGEHCLSDGGCPFLSEQLFPASVIIRFLERDQEDDDDIGGSVTHQLSLSPLETQLISILCALVSSSP